MSALTSLPTRPLLALLLIGFGAAVGVWQAAQHYRPLVDNANGQLSRCKSAQGNLEALATEQGLKLGELVLAGESRERAAALAMLEAKQEARPHYAAANRLLHERTGGEQCTAAAAVIDQELGL